MHKSLTGMASNIDTTTTKINGNALYLVYKYYIYYAYYSHMHADYLIFFGTKSIFPKSFIL